MIPLEEAVRLVLENVDVLDAVEADLGEALGRVLAEDVLGDISIPPFNRSAMDGYAVVAADTRNAPVSLRVIETVAAGAGADLDVEPGTAARIMTGAPVPNGADAVIMVEKTHTDGETVVIEETVPAGKNIAPMGQDIAAGQVALPRGSLLRPEEIGILAMVGAARPSLIRKPTVATLVTGDELVPVTHKPTGAQIRETNSHALRAQLAADRLPVEHLGIVTDERTALARKIKEGFRADLLILSGGVSMGDRDFVPPVLAELGAETIFHKTAIKPGKPVLFARKGACRIFGLPGNPVSALIVHELLIRPAIRKMMGHAEPVPPRRCATLRGRLPKIIGRRQFLPARVEATAGDLVAELVDWHGSGDLISLQRADGYIVIPEKPAQVREGDRLEVLLRDL